MSERVMEIRPEVAKYGIDAPPAIGVFCALAVAFFALAWALAPGAFAYVAGAVGAWLFATGMAFVTYALIGKFRHRETMLAMVPWTGRETVLDVGTGRGFLLVGAAKKLTSGKAYGIDVWSNEDLSRNSPENTLRNIVLEGVESRAEVRSEDARRLGFADATFDVVLSNLCLHNIAGRADREAACREIARVLKPGGTALISDFKNTGDYAGVFRSCGLCVSFGPRYWLSILAPFPLRVVKAEKTA